MQYKFHACGHPNIRATHKATLEFTKDKEVTLKGDCIVGVSTDFELNRLKDFIKKANSKKISIIIETPDKEIKETINAELNPHFSSEMEIVIRKTDFVSERTFGVKADKAAFELNRGLIKFLKAKRNKIAVTIGNKD